MPKFFINAFGSYEITAQNWGIVIADNMASARQMVKSLRGWSDCFDNNVPDHIDEPDSVDINECIPIPDLNQNVVIKMGGYLYPGCVVDVGDEDISIQLNSGEIVLFSFGEHGTHSDFFDVWSRGDEVYFEEVK
jgi:hypothetical protein